MRILPESRRASAVLLLITVALAACALEFTLHVNSWVQHFVVYLALQRACARGRGRVHCARAGERARACRVDTDRGGGRLLGRREHDLDVCVCRPASRRPTRRSPTRFGWRCTRPSTSRCCCCCARVPALSAAASGSTASSPGLAVAAVGTAVVFQAVLEATSGSKAAIATNLAYPLADLTTIALVVWVLAVSGWRIGRAWGLIAAGLLVFSVSDCLYLFQTACRLVRCRRRDRPGLGRRLRAARLGGMATGRAADSCPPRGLGGTHRADRLRPAGARRARVRPLPARQRRSPSCSRRRPSWPCSCASR